MSPATTLLLLALLGSASLAGAQERDDTDPYWRFRDSIDYDERLAEKWQEQTTEVPPLPDDDGLSPMQVDRLPPGMRAYIDLPTLAVGEDLVVRYWLVIKGDGGGYNATFEGTRCASGEYRVYAYGYPRRDPPIVDAGGSPWQDTGFPAYRAEITRDFLCTGTTPKSPRQIANVLRHGTGPNQSFEGHIQF
jgi:hypothetical protein